MVPLHCRCPLLSQLSVTGISAVQAIILTHVLSRGNVAKCRHMSLSPELAKIPYPSMCVFFGQALGGGKR